MLIIDDDQGFCYALSSMLSREGHDATCALNLGDGLKEAKSGSFEVIFLDVCLPDGNGLDALSAIRETPASPEVIILTGEGDPDGAELAIKSGAWDYIQKPFSIDALRLSLTRVLQYRGEKRPGKPAVSLKRDGIIGNSPKIKHCLDLMARAANTETNVLLTGETGTGKELFARAIHDNSTRAGKNFVVVDCACLTETLVESMLFGHEKGAFTGADKAREGLVKQADGGTLFLDEVGELPLTLQRAFLRVLQERRFRPVGGKHEIESDFRLIAATNRNLDQMVHAGRFRDDLVFRLRSIVIDLPPLRERTEDIRELAMHYMSRFCTRYGRGTKGFSPEFFEALHDYQWPGNVRELVNSLDRALSMARNDSTLFSVHLPTQIRIQLARASVAPAPSNKSHSEKTPVVQKSFPDLKTLVGATEKQYLEDLVAFTGGNIMDLCRISGLSRANVYARLKKYNISRHF